jgi:hypothetical protein
VLSTFATEADSGGVGRYGRTRQKSRSKSHDSREAEPDLDRRMDTRHHLDG